MNSPPSLCSLSFSPPLLPSSSIIPAAQWMNRADSRERFFLYQTGVHYSRVCENSAWFYNTHPLVWSARTRLFDLSIDRTDESSYDHCFSQNDHLSPFPSSLARMRSIIALVHFFLIFHASLFLSSTSLESE